MKSSIDAKKNVIRELFSEELFYNVRIREYILAGVFFILICFMMINLFLVNQDASNSISVRNAFLGLVILLIVLIIRSFVLRKILEKKKHQIKKYIRRLRFVNAVFEASIPTAAIILLTFFLEPIIAVNSPAVFLYFVFILVSILDLDFKVCAVVGIVTASEYLFISLYFLESFNSVTDLEIFVLPIAYIAKSMIMLVSGLAAGAIAVHIKKKIIGSLETIQDRNELEKAFGQQVSKEIVDEFIENKLEISSKKRNVTVMFLDIRNFSKYCEGKTPEEINNYQNEVLSFMIDIVKKNRGIVNQILGDGFMATFGAPVEDEKHSDNAVKAANEIIRQLNLNNEEAKIDKTKIGIGIHCGEVITGNVGTEDRKQYSVTGNAVILAARLEQLNKEFNSSVLVSKDVIDKMNIEDIEHRSLGNVTVKGFANPIEVYKLS
jgi:adenylate cyclase